MKAIVKRQVRLIMAITHRLNWKLAAEVANGPSPLLTGDMVVVILMKIHVVELSTDDGKVFTTPAFIKKFRATARKRSWT